MLNTSSIHAGKYNEAFIYSAANNYLKRNVV